MSTEKPLFRALSLHTRRSPPSHSFYPLNYLNRGHQRRSTLINFERRVFDSKIKSFGFDEKQCTVNELWLSIFLLRRVSIKVISSTVCPCRRWVVERTCGYTKWLSFKDRTHWTKTLMVLEVRGLRHRSLHLITGSETPETSSFKFRSRIQYSFLLPQPDCQIGGNPRHFPCRSILIIRTSLRRVGLYTTQLGVGLFDRAGCPRTERLKWDPKKFV